MTAPELNEIYLFHANIFMNQKNYSELKTFLIKHEKKILDKLSFMEYKTDCTFRLNEFH